MGLNLKLKSTVTGLSDLKQGLLIFAVSVLPPVIVLMQQQSSNVFLYGSAILGGVLAFSIKMLSNPEPVPATVV